MATLSNEARLAMAQAANPTVETNGVTTTYLVGNGTLVNCRGDLQHGSAAELKREYESATYRRVSSEALTHKQRIEILGRFVDEYDIRSAIIDGIKGYCVTCEVGASRSRWDMFISWGGNFLKQRKASPDNSKKWGKVQVKNIPFVDAYLAKISQ